MGGGHPNWAARANSPPIVSIASWLSIGGMESRLERSMRSSSAGSFTGRAGVRLRVGLHRVPRQSDSIHSKVSFTCSKCGSGDEAPMFLSAVGPLTAAAEGRDRALSRAEIQHSRLPPHLFPEALVQDCSGPPHCWALGAALPGTLQSTGANLHHGAMLVRDCCPGASGEVLG